MRTNVNEIRLSALFFDGRLLAITRVREPGLHGRAGKPVLLANLCPRQI
jgi:hypothetical protein